MSVIGVLMIWVAVFGVIQALGWLFFWRYDKAEKPERAATMVSLGLDWSHKLMRPWWACQRAAPRPHPVRPSARYSSVHGAAINCGLGLPFVTT
jgi:hypothetical protein